MTCETVKIGDATAIVCTRRRQSRHRCAFCQSEGHYQCDFPGDERRPGQGSA